MKMPAKAGAAQQGAAVVTLDTFLHNFSVSKLMDKIADLEQHDLRAKIAAMSRPQNQQPAQQQKPSAGVAFIQDLQLVDKLLVSFQRQASAFRTPQVNAPCINMLPGQCLPATMGLLQDFGAHAKEYPSHQQP